MNRGNPNLSPRIVNRKAMHEYFIEAKIECGMVLMGSEVKSLRLGRCQLQESFARVDGGQLYLIGCHIDPYANALVNSHEPTRPRKLLAHKREVQRLIEHTDRDGSTLIPLAIYFKDGRAKVELGVAHGKTRHDKRQSIKKKEHDQQMRRATTHRQ